MTQHFRDYVRNLNRVHLLEMIDRATLMGRIANARASLIANPLDGRVHNLRASFLDEATNR